VGKPGDPLILVVEDEHLVRELVLLVLAEAGFDTLDASSGVEAIDLMRRQSRAIGGLVTDVNLSIGPNGWEVAAFAREMWRDIAVVYVTGDSANQWRTRGLAGSVLIEKPFSPADVAKTMTGLLG
jgi:CheY-like chemotaxis protein